MLEPYIKVLASIYTALLMTAVTLLLFYGGLRIQPKIAKARVIQAAMVDISQLKSRKISKPEPIKKPNTPVSKNVQPDKKTEQVKVKTPVKEDKKEENKQKQAELEKLAKARALKLKKQKEDRLKAQKLKEKKEKERLNRVKQAKEKKRKEEQLRKKRLEQKKREKERKEQLEKKKKLEALRKKRKEAEKRSKQYEQELKDLVRQSQEKNPSENTDTVINNPNGESKVDELGLLLNRYQSAVISAVESHWNRPVSSNKNLICHVKVHQIPGGGVIDATISSPCNANAVVKKSIIDAIKKSDPLPYKGFEKVFVRKATFIFQPND